MKRVVITGIGPVFEIGKGKDEFFRNLFEGNAVLKRIPDDYYYGDISSKWYVPYPAIDTSAYCRDIQRIFMMAPKNAVTSLASAILALEDAKIEKPEKDTCVFWGIGAPNMTEIRQGFNCVDQKKPLHPCINPMMMPSSASAWISVAFGLHGANQVCSTACASGTTAIGSAFEHIRFGKAKTAICGGAECFCNDSGLVLKSFDVLGAISSSKDGYPRPLSKERSGFLYSEGGACCLILEEYDTAKARGAKIYAEITGYESCCDGYHIVQMPQEPDEIINMMFKLVGKDRVDYYNAHGTGTVVNDRNEAKIIKSVFDGYSDDVYVNSTKGIIGHTVGASGAVEAAVCAYSIKNNIVHKNIISDPIDDLNLPLETVKTEICCAVSASFGFGGNNAALKFKKVEES